MGERLRRKDDHFYSLGITGGCVEHSGRLRDIGIVAEWESVVSETLRPHRDRCLLSMVL